MVVSERAISVAFECDACKLRQLADAGRKSKHASIVFIVLFPAYRLKSLEDVEFHIVWIGSLHSELDELGKIWHGGGDDSKLWNNGP